MTHGHHDPEENLPEWLRALRRQQEEQAVQPEPSAAPSPADEPNWLQEIRQRYRPDRPGAEAQEPAAEPEEETPAPALEDTQPQLPLRLDNLEPEPPPEDFAETLETGQPFEPEAELKAETQGEAVPEPEAWLAYDAEETDPTGDSLELPATPAFIDESTAEDAFPSTPAFSEDPEGLLTEPGWLESLRPIEDFPQEDARSAAMLPEGPEQAGPLAGLSDVLPTSQLVGQIGKSVEYSTRLQVTGSQRQHAAVLQDLLQSEELSTTDPVERPLANRLLGLLGSLFIISAVLIPLITGSQSASRPDSTLAPEVRNLFNSIDVLPVGAPVLVAFDLQPAQSGEVAPAVSAVLGHLLEKQARLVLLSTQEAGPALAERLLAEHLGATPLVSTGSYINLGYLSGGSAALRSLASDPRAVILSGPERSDPWQTPALQSIQHLRDFAMILVVAGDGDSVRVWLEQVAPELPAGVYALTSAQAQPLLRTYLQSSPPSLRGLVSGVSGAVIYERLQADVGLGRRYWDSYSYGLGAMVLVILFGSLYSRLAQTTEVKTAKPPGASNGA